MSFSYSNEIKDFINLYENLKSKEYIKLYEQGLEADKKFQEMNDDNFQYKAFFEKCKEINSNFNQIDMVFLSKALNDVNQIDNKEQNYWFVKFVFDFDKSHLENFKKNIIKQIN